MQHHPHIFFGCQHDRWRTYSYPSESCRLHHQSSAKRWKSCPWTCQLQACSFPAWWIVIPTLCPRLVTSFLCHSVVILFFLVLGTPAQTPPNLGMCLWENVLEVSYIVIYALGFLFTTQGCRGYCMYCNLEFPAKHENVRAESCTFMDGWSTSKHHIWQVFHPIGFDKFLHTWWACTPEYGWIIPPCYHSGADGLLVLFCQYQEVGRLAGTTLEIGAPISMQQPWDTKSTNELFHDDRGYSGCFLVMHSKGFHPLCEVVTQDHDMVFPSDSSWQWPQYVHCKPLNWIVDRVLL